VFHDQGHTSQDTICLRGNIEEPGSSGSLGEYPQVTGYALGLNERPGISFSLLVSQFINMDGMEQTVFRIRTFIKEELIA
jgi:hypothetical protein